MKDNAEKKNAGKIHAEKTYAGAAIDKADGDKVTPQAVKQETSMLNNNPRND